jgi:hypothetical protein
VPEPLYDDDVLIDDEWGIDDGFDDPYTPQAPATRNPTPQRSSRPASNPQTNQGTAAQIDRLRRNLGRGSRSSSVPPARDTGNQPAQQTGRYTSPQDDSVYPGNAFEDPAYPPSTPAQRSRTPQPATRQGQSTQPAARTSRNRRPAIQEDIVYEDVEVYEEYDDDFSEYDAPRRPARQTRPSPQFRMPAITRPTLPTAIAKADLVNDAPSLGIIGVGLVSLAGMAILVANRADTLAPQFATHVSASGVLERFSDESAIWNLPLMAAMFTLMNIVVAWFVSPIDRFASRFVLTGAIVAQFVAWVALFRIL